MHPEESIRYKEFTDVTFVRGGTLERFLHDPHVSKQMGAEWYWIYQPTPHMIDIQCDGCIKAHSEKNLDCSATHARKSPAADPNTLYPFRNLKGRAKHRVRLEWIDYPSKIQGCILLSR